MYHIITLYTLNLQMLCVNNSSIKLGKITRVVRGVIRWLSAETMFFQNPFKMRQVLECTFFRCKRAKPIRIQFTPTLNHMVLGKFFWFPANLCKNIHWIENHNCTLYTVFYNLGNYGFKVINSVLDQDEATLPLADKTPAVTAPILEWAVEWSLSAITVGVQGNVFSGCTFLLCVVLPKYQQRWVRSSARLHKTLMAQHSVQWWYLRLFPLL